MRTAVILVLVVPLGILAQQGNIGGQVRSAITGEPVARADLLLRRADVDPNLTDLPTSYSAVADEKGHFVFEAVEPGKYRLSATHAGFIAAEFGAPEPLGIGTTLSIDVNQKVGNMAFTLTPQAVFAGHVFDERGDPVPRIQVQALDYRYNRGKKQLAVFGTALTDDLGEYRIFGLAPGRYFLSATHRANALETSGTSATQGSDEDYAPMYYPRGSDPTFATTIEARPGAQLTGMDFMLSKSPTVHVRGRVTNPAGGIFTVIVAPRDHTRMLDANRTYMTDPQGRFEIRGITPGPYTVIASVLDSGGYLTTRRSLDITGNVEDLAITIPPPLRLTGRIRVDGDQESISNVRVSLRLRQPSTPFGPLPSAKVDTNGSFTLSQVSPDTYDPIAVGLPDDAYVKSIKLGDQEVLDSGLDLTRTPAGSIEILISPHAGFVDGAVVDQKGEPARGATVVLVPQKENRQNREQYYGTTTTDQNGRFVLKSLNPGDYKTFAWEDVEFDAWMDPAFLKLVEDKGQPITIGEDSRQQIQLRAIPAVSR